MAKLILSLYLVAKFQNTIIFGTSDTILAAHAMRISAHLPMNLAILGLSSAQP